MTNNCQMRLKLKSGMNKFEKAVISDIVKRLKWNLKKQKG